MATKRTLYKPVQSNVGKKRNRRPLAQGRLVTASVQSVPSGPRLQQGEINETQASLMSTHSKIEDPNATPRRAIPHVTEHHSPLPSPPTHTLDLSDCDDDDQNDTQVTLQHTPRAAAPHSSGTQPPIHHIPHVMVLDASALSHSPDRADVDCVVGYERSPATVICHSQSASSKSPGSREEAVWKVQVDQVPRVSTLLDTDAISPLTHSTDVGDRGTVKAVSPLHTDDDIDTMVSRPSKQQNIRSARKTFPTPKLPQPCFDESGESEKADSGGKQTKKKQVSSLPAEVTSDSDTCSLFEYVPQIKNRPKTAEGVRKAPKSEKKRKGERTVPSRYMQSAMSKNHSGSASVSADRSVLAKKTLNVGSSNSSNNAAKSTGKKTPSQSQPTRMYPNSSSPDRGKTRVPQGKTSTPTHDGVPNMTSCDASAINPELSMLSAIDASHLKLGVNSGSGHSSGHGSPKKQMKKADLRIQQQRLDLSYARYLQWLFLDSRASCMLQQQERNAMKQLSALWEVKEEKQREKAELERDVARLHHLNVLDEQLEKQERALEPLVKLLSTLQKDYSGLAAALDTTRHQINVHGIHIPEDEEYYLASLEHVLKESEQLLGTLNMMTKKQAPVIKEFSDAIKAVEKAVDAECLELYRCGELLAAVQSLATHENSLRIQAMQTNR